MLSGLLRAPKIEHRGSSHSDIRVGHGETHSARREDRRVQRNFEGAQVVRPRSCAAFEKLNELALLLERRLDAFPLAVGLLEPRGENVAGVVSRRQFDEQPPGLLIRDRSINILEDEDQRRLAQLVADDKS